MNSQTKFLISMLFIVVIILCVVLTRFYFDVTKNTESHARDSRVESVVKSFGEYQVFRSADGGYGLLNSDLTVLIEPDWLEILDVTENMVLVSSRIDNQVLIGGIDYEENVILPLVFRSMEKLGDGFHLGTVSEDNRCILYDRNYQPVFRESFASVSYYNKLLTLEQDSEILYYDTSEQPPALRSAEFSCQITENLYLNWKIANQFYLSELTVQDLRDINRMVSAYMQMLRENNFLNLQEVTTPEYFSILAKNGILNTLTPDSADSFSFSRRESGAYDFAFRLCTSAPEQQNMKIHLYFRKNTENQMILTAADLTPAAEE